MRTNAAHFAAPLVARSTALFSALSTALFSALLAAALPGAVRAEGRAPVVLVQPGPESARPFQFQLVQYRPEQQDKGSAAEVLCTSEGYKKAKAAAKAAHAALKPGGDLKNYIFQKSADAKGEHHFWELREGKKHQTLLCRSGLVADRAQAEHSASVAAKAFKQATITVK